MVSSTTPLASALKATQKVTENNAQQALSLAETLAANATLTRELETLRQQLKQARNNQQGGDAMAGAGITAGEGAMACMDVGVDSKGGGTTKAMTYSQQAVCATMGAHNTLTCSSRTSGVASRPALSWRLAILTCPGG